MTDSAISEFHSEHSPPPRQRRDANYQRAAVAAPRPRSPTKSNFAVYRAHLWANCVPFAFGIVVVLVIAIGWLNRDEDYLTPETGLGYWLGIVGASAMLLLLLYPLRKRMRSLTALGTTAFWFRTHMLLGIVGPVLILFHANFRLGSINSNIALTTMLIVATSGIVGRYLYGKIHVGLYGRKAQVREILADVHALKNFIGDDLPVADRIVAQLNEFAQFGTNSRSGVLAGLWSLPVISVRARVTRSRVLAEVRQIIAIEAKRLGWSRRIQRRRLAAVSDLITLHNAAVKKAAAFALYHHLFGLWHLLHLPLFILLVFAAIVHIFAAHFF